MVKQWLLNILSVCLYSYLSYPTCKSLRFCSAMLDYYRGADKSLAQPDWKNNWKVATFRPTRRSLLPRRPGWRGNFLIFFEWLSKVRVWSLLLVSFLVGLRTFQHPGICGISGSTIFFDIVLWRARFEREIYILIFNTTFIWNISHSKQNSVSYYHTCT